MPQRELERLQAVHRFMNLEIHKEAELQEIVEIAAELCETPVALITLNDEDTQYFKFKVGTDLDQTVRQDTFCKYTIQSQELMVVPDTLKDKRFRKNPYVVNTPQIRFYAGAPLVTHDGLSLGTICIMDVQPKELTNPQRHLLKVLAKRVIQFIEFEYSLEILKKQFLKARNSEIKLRSFFESSVACHLLLGKEMEVLAYNRNMAELLEKRHGVKLRSGIKVHDILQGDPLEVFISDYTKALKGTTLRFEREVKYRTGDIIWWDVTFEPGYDPDGEIIGVSYNAVDITERKLHEQRILSQNESLKQIAHIQSHDLRRPVASILGLVNVIRGENCTVTPEVVNMLESATNELDAKIKAIVGLAD